MHLQTPTLDDQMIQNFFPNLLGEPLTKEEVDLEKAPCTIAIEEREEDLVQYLMDCYPNAEIVYYKSALECIRQLQKGYVENDDEHYVFKIEDTGIGINGRTYICRK